MHPPSLAIYFNSSPPQSGHQTRAQRSWYGSGAGPCTSRFGPQTARNRILQLGGTVATHTLGGKHDLAAEAANMKPLTVELHVSL